MANKVKFLGDGDGYTDNGVHFRPPFGSDHTLCGLTLDGDTKTAGSFLKTKEKVDCYDCIRIVEFGKSIKNSEYKPSNPQ